MQTDARSADTFSAVTPSDTVDITTRGGAYPRGLYVGVGGDVVVVTQGNTAVTFKAVPTGTTLPVRVRRVNATSTTATDIVALY